MQHNFYFKLRHILFSLLIFLKCGIDFGITKQNFAILRH